MNVTNNQGWRGVSGEAGNRSAGYAPLGRRGFQLKRIQPLMDYRAAVE